MENKEQSFPFDSILDEQGEYDRLYFSEDFANYFKQFIGNGVYPNPSNNLQVLTLNNNFDLTVKAGSGFINGYGYILKEDTEININVSHKNYSRKDIIILKLDLIERDIKLLVKEGLASANAIKPQLDRNSDTWEMQLAEITVKAGTNKILPSDILDTRLNNQVCGIVTGLVEQADTTELFNQYDSYLKQKIEEWKITQENQDKEFKTQMTEIEAWYNDIKLDITKIQNFDFDNLASFEGATKDTEFLSSGDIKETIISTTTKSKISERLTQFLSSGDIKVTTIVYERDGSVMKEIEVLTKFNANGDITEVVS